MKPTVTQLGNQNNLSFMEESVNDYGASPLYSQQKLDMMKVKVSKRGLSTQITSKAAT